MDKNRARIRIKNFDMIIKNRLGPYYLVLKHSQIEEYVVSFESLKISPNKEIAHKYCERGGDIKERINNNLVTPFLLTATNEIKLSVNDLL